MNILVSRTDRAGDFILTLPVFRELRKAFPEAHIVAHIRKYTAPIAKLCKEIDEVILDDDFAPGLFDCQLSNCFKDHDFDRAIIVHPAARTIIAAYHADIPVRTGRASNICMFFLNDKRIQKRSKNEKHEYEYNLDLLEGIVPNIEKKPYHFDLAPDLVAEGRKIIDNLGITDSPVIVHPGHGGSALNISSSKYARLAEELIEAGKSVIVSLGPGEEDIESKFEHLKKTNKIAFLTGIPTMDKLAGVFANCSGFVGGSTGPLHLAAALNKPCAAFFPPVKAMTPKRWGPVGCESFITKPELPDCSKKCLRCKHTGCMQVINVEPAVSWLLERLK